MIVMDWLKKAVDIIVPPIDQPEEEENVVTKTEEKTTQTQAQTQFQAQQQPTQAQNLAETVAAHRAVAGGGSYAYKSTTTNSRPNLKVIKPPEFVMKVYKPADYNNINCIAQDILDHKAAVVNYEYVHADEQRRICDYVDGVCYAVDGKVTKISEKIFLYVPSGINTSDIAALVASVNYR